MRGEGKTREGRRSIPRHRVAFRWHENPCMFPKTKRAGKMTATVQRDAILSKRNLCTVLYLQWIDPFMASFVVG